MKIFEVNDSVNFVDENNVLVGYETDQHCCEDAGWFLAHQPTEYSRDDVDSVDVKPEDYTFEPHYVQERSGGDLNDGTMMIFKLVHPTKSDLFLHIYNAHNGYYGHGFKTENFNDNVEKEGWL